MNRLIYRIYGPLVVLVDALLFIDIATDLMNKYKDRKAEKKAIVSDSVVEKEPTPVTEGE